MSPLSRNSTIPLAGELRIFAYGFDARGFSTHQEPVHASDIGQIEFIDFYHPVSLEIADGVIVPQGIFEKLQSCSSTFGPRTKVTVDKSWLLERERQVFNLLRAGKWVCFLVGEIIDDVSQGIHLESIDDTDLCKRILNAFAVRRHHRYHLSVDAPVKVRTREHEFDAYASHYGIPTTVFELPHQQPIERRVLFELGDQPVGVEFDAGLFFLPFYSAEKSWSAALSIVKTVTRSIADYRRNRIVEIPHWVDDVRFKSEENLYLEINSLLEKVNRLESQLFSWRDYKSILTTSDGALRNKVVAILESVFDLKVELGEDPGSAIIMRDEQHPAAIMGTQSTEGELQEDAIARTDRLRQSHGLPETMPAILVVNDHSLVHDVWRRSRARVPRDLARCAKNRNILILRTIDLLFLMQELESNPHRKTKVMQFLLSGGGCLEADGTHHDITPG